jgi:hypothetical protein
MTKSNPFSAAVAKLQEAVTDVQQRADELGGFTSLELARDYEAAIAFLEAGKKVDKNKAIVILERLCDPEFTQKDRDVLVALSEEVMPLLAAIPDGDKQ